MSNPTEIPLSYKDAGVDIEAADNFVSDIASLAKATHTKQVVPNKTAYAGLVRPMLGGIEDPLIAATCDGVGTKLLVARDAGMYRGLGQDLVAMNVNDLLPAGAQPLLFLDYIATGKLDPKALTEVVAGVADACKESGCALLGGETAEMPGVYADGDFDLAGFAVGMVDGNRIPDPTTLEAGDAVLALSSSGVHSNGFSLVRKALFERAQLDIGATLPGFECSLGQVLLEPTKLYVKPVLEAMNQFPIKAAAHITGGGLLGRAEKLIPDELSDTLSLCIDPQKYERPPIFQLIQDSGSISNHEMSRTFNMGLGFLIIVPQSVVSTILETARGPWIHVGNVKTKTSHLPRVDLGYAQV